MKIKKGDDFKFKFLVDEPIKSVKELNLLRFGHKELGYTVASIVKECPTPFTIGLFGKWGSGKSTLAYFIKEELKDVMVPVIIFDVWKHEKDNELRRTFLKDLVFQLKQYYGKTSFGTDIFEDGDEKFKVTDRLDSSISKDSKGSFVVNWKKVKQSWRVIMLPIILLLGVLTGTYFLNDRILFWTIASYSAAVISSGAFLATVLKLSTTFINTETTTIGLDRFQDPIEFEKEFARVLNNVKDRYKRFLIVFDNLDRVNHDRALEILATIKTFLEPRSEELNEKDVVFLIPCDVSALRRHIKLSYKVEDTDVYDPDEFLRKFFVATIWIPDFIISELEKFTKDKLKGTKVKDFTNETVSYLITQAFRKNPRQIIQFINVLLSNYLLIQDRQREGKDFPENFLQENVPQLTRFLILRQNYHEEMEKIDEEKVKDLNPEQLRGINYHNKGRKDEFISFVEGTEALAPIQNIRLFFNMRRSEQEKLFPGIIEFFAWLEDGKLEESRDFIENIEDFEAQKSSFSDVIKEQLENIVNPVSKARTINSLLDSLDHSGKRLSKTAYDKIYNSIVQQTKVPIRLISPKNLANQLLEPFSSYRKGIIKEWIGIIKTEVERDKKVMPEEELKVLLKVLLENYKWIDKTTSNELKSYFGKAPFYELWATRLLSETSERQEKFLSEDYVDDFILSVVPKEVTDSLADILDLVEGFQDKFFTENVCRNLIKKLSYLISDFNSKGFNNNQNIVIRKIREILLTHGSKIKSLDNQQDWEQLWIPLNQYFNTIPNWDERAGVVLVSIELRNIVPDSIKGQIDGQISAFIQNGSINSIESIFKNLGVDRTKDFIQDQVFEPLLEQKALANQEFFDYLYTISSNVYKQQLLIKLIDVDLQRALNEIEKKYKHLSNTTEILNKLIEKFDTVGNDEKTQIANIHHLTKCANKKPQIMDSLVSKIENHLKNPDRALQNVGLQAISGSDYINKTRLRDLSKNVFDWVKQEAVANRRHSLPMKAVYDLKQLSKSEKQELEYFTFELLRTSSEQSEILVSGDLLKELKPKYSKEKENNFVDLRSRIEKEQNEGIRSFLIQILKDLRPNKLSKINREFWSWVDKQ